MVTAAAPVAFTVMWPLPVLVTVTAPVALLLIVMRPFPVLVAVRAPPLLTIAIVPVPTSVAVTTPPLFCTLMKPLPATRTTSAAALPVTVMLGTTTGGTTGTITAGTPLTLMTVFTMVIAAKSASALPFRVVTVALPAVEKVIPALAMMVPAMEPPPAPLMVAALPTCQYTLEGWAPLTRITLREASGVPTVRELAIWKIHTA